MALSARHSAVTRSGAQQHLGLAKARRSNAVRSVELNASNKDALVEYQFIVPRFETSWGQVLKVVGSPTELGSWNPVAAPVMQWNEGHKWTLTTRFPKQPLNFKLISDLNGLVKWEEEGKANRSIDMNSVANIPVAGTFAATAAPVDLVVQLTCTFGDTATTKAELYLPHIEPAQQDLRSSMSSAPAPTRPSSPLFSQAISPAASHSGPVASDKELAAKIASLERQIKDANSEARKAPLVAQLNALRSGRSYPVPISIGPSSGFAQPKTPASSYTVDDKELAVKIASLERQIKDANSEARKSILTSQLNALRSGSSYSPPTSATHSSGPSRAKTPAPSHSAPVVANKELAAKIASLERQIKDANSEARKAPLIAQLKALRV